MSEEGHYESLDLQKKDDAVQEDLRTKTRKDKGLPKKIRKSGRRPLRVVVGCLGMLCLILLAVNIVQAVHFNKNLTLENTKLKSAYMNLTLERTQLESAYINLTLERTQLESAYKNLTLERTQLESAYKNLTLEHTQLESAYKNLNVKCQIAESCPSGWKMFGCSCYYRTTVLKTWQEAREYCLNQGADLVVINNGEEQEFIRGLWTVGDYGSWIGLNRTEGSWTWVDGTPLTTQYWRSGIPDNHEDMNCADYDHRSTDPGWTNWPCSFGAPSICEK